MKTLIISIFILVGTQRPAPEMLKEFNLERITTYCQDIYCLSDSICNSIGVPPKLVYEIGQNESRWTWVVGKAGDLGYLQILPRTFEFWREKLKLEGGHTELNNLIVGITYLKSQHKRYGSWRKARFAYARGHWRDETTWTCLEEKFMSRIDWDDYE